MKDRYRDLIERPEVRAVHRHSAGLPRPEVLEMLKELRAVKPVWVELGLQTSNEETAGTSGAVPK